MLVPVSQNDASYLHVVKMFIVLGRLFMRGSTGVSTGGSGHPLPHGKAQSCNYLRITGSKSTKLQMSCHHRTASEAPFMMFRWRADGCPFWLLSVSVQVYYN